MVRVAISAFALALAGCATVPPAPAPETITYTTSACHGFCPVYSVMVASTGQGIFTGREHTAVVGDRQIEATPAQIAAFAAALSPYRPASGAVHLDSPEVCGTRYATDLPGLVVTWAGTETRTLSVDYGCDMEKNRAMFAALKAAPAALPIAELVGKR